MPTLNSSKMSYVQETRKCGNPRCKKCPHGPYWVGYQYVDGKRVKTYFGRQDPRPAEERDWLPHPAMAEQIERAKKNERIQQLAFVLGAPYTDKRELVRKRVWGLIDRAMKRKPPDHERVEEVKAAWAELRKLKDWE